jgi:hypothetical protein
MPTVITHTLKKDGSGDYTTIKAWIAAVQRDLVAADEIAQLDIYKAGWNDATPLVESYIDFRGFTTDATRRVEVNVVDSDRHTFIANTGFVLGFSGSYGLVAEAGCHVTFTGLELADSAISYTFTALSDCKMVKCLTRGITRPSYNGYAENSLVVLTENRPDDTGLAYKDATLVNCAVILVGTGGGWNGDVGLRDSDCTNTLCYRAQAKITYDPFFTCTGDYNASNDTSSPGANSVDNITTADLVDYAGGDYRTKASSSLATAGSGGTFIGAFLEESGGEPTFQSAWALGVNTIIG